MNVGFYHPKAGTRHAGGKAIYVQQMARALADDHDVYLYTETGPLTETIRDSAVTTVQIPPADGAAVEAAVRHLTPFSGRDVPTVLTYIGALRTDAFAHVSANVDVLLTHHYLDDLLVSRAVDVPVAYQYHGFRSVGLGAWTRERFSAAEGHLVNSRQTAREVRERLGREADEVVYPGVDADRFDPGADPAFDREAPTVLFVGRVVEGKGVFDLVDAVAALPRSDVQLSVVGRGDVEGVRQRAAASGIADRVTLEGVVPHDRLPGYYVAADVLAYPSYYESFGLVNVEAMACGTPVVSTDIGGIREYATDGESALLVAPGDVAALREALQSVLSSPDRRAALGAAGRAVAAEYTWTRQAERLAAYCRTLVE